MKYEDHLDEVATRLALAFPNGVSEKQAEAIVELAELVMVRCRSRKALSRAMSTVMLPLGIEARHNVLRNPANGKSFGQWTVRVNPNSA